MPPSAIIVICTYLVMSIVTFAAYGWDKRAAVQGGRRLRNMDLHILALLGGFPGALLGQRLFRHKRRKRAFMIVTWSIVLLQTALWLAFTIRAVTSS